MATDEGVGIFFCVGFGVGSMVKSAKITKLAPHSQTPEYDLLRSFPFWSLISETLPFARLQKLFPLFPLVEPALQPLTLPTAKDIHLYEGGYRSNWTKSSFAGCSALPPPRRGAPRPLDARFVDAPIGNCLSRVSLVPLRTVMSIVQC